MEPIPLPAPFQGKNTRASEMVLANPQCRDLLNFNTTENGIELRHGNPRYSKWNRQNTSSTPILLAPYSEGEFYLATFDDVANNVDVYNVQTGGVVYTIAQSVVPEMQFLAFSRSLYFFIRTGTGAPGFYYNGAAWAPIGWTSASGAWVPFGGNSFKNRAYVLSASTSSGAIYFYSGISATSGPMTLVNLNGIFSTWCYLVAIASTTVADNISSQSFQCFIANTGEVLFYSGSYPDAADWSLVGRANIGTPLSWNTTVAYNGDTLVMCDTGMISLRDVFLKGGRAAQDLAISASISPTWTALIKGIRSTYAQPESPIKFSGGTLNGYYIRAVWDSVNNRIIIGFPVYLDDDGAVQIGFFNFVYDTERLAWTEHLTTAAAGVPVVDMAIYQQKVFFVSYSTSIYIVWEKEGAVGFTDRDSTDVTELGYDFDVLSAPIAQSRAWVQVVAGMDIFVQSDMYDQTSWQLIRDFGVEETALQKIPGSAIEGDIAKPFLNAGIEGSFVQYRATGSTVDGKTVGVVLYGVNVWPEVGNSPR